MSEYNELIKNPNDKKTQEMDAIFAPVMSPSWSKRSIKSRKAAEEAEKNPSLKTKLKKFFS